MATLMTIIDPSLPLAREEFWRKATQTGYVGREASEMIRIHMVRREKDVLTTRLPEKKIRSKEILPCSVEIEVYAFYEAQFINLLKQLSRLSLFEPPGADREKNMLMKTMLSIATCMRMTLVHPMLPKGGRDWSIKFSPSRCHLVKRLEQPHRCVCCGRYEKKRAQKKYDKEILDLFADSDMPDSDGEEDDDDMTRQAESEADLEKSLTGCKGKIIEIPRHICQNVGTRLRHYAHEKCLPALQRDDAEKDGIGCPKCARLKKLARFTNVHQTAQLKSDPVLNYESHSVRKPESTSGRIIAPHINGGFNISAKLDSIVSDLFCIPHGEKALVMSFFKGSLDLLEAVLYYDGKLSKKEYERFDGDIDSAERQKILNRFKRDANCRFLLMTVHTGGTGLNIVEANHVLFMDRWFNPFVHEQAQDR